MSKHSRRKARHRRKHVKPVAHAMCQNCAATYPATPQALLSALAQAINACHDAGLKPRFRHDVVYSREGYVLPFKGRWEPRLSVTLPAVTVDAAASDDDDEL